MSWVYLNDYNEYASRYNPRFDYLALSGGLSCMNYGKGGINVPDYAMIKTAVMES